jgi:RNA polymerase sigma factor (sigma-70 family)
MITMKYLIDADLLLDALLNRLHISEEAHKLWEFLEEGATRGYITALGQDKILSICETLVESDAYDDVAYSIESIASACPVDAEVLQHARLLKLKDFESAVEVACIEDCGLDGVVTQSPENFEGERVRILSVEEFILLQQQSAEKEALITKATSIAASGPRNLEIPPEKLFEVHSDLQHNTKDLIADDSIEKPQSSYRSVSTLETSSSGLYEGAINSEAVTSSSIQRFVRSSLAKYSVLNGIFEIEDIVKRTYARSDGSIDLNTIDEVHVAWFKTTCIAVLEELNQLHERKCQFNAAIEELFDKSNPEARSLWASVQRMLWQYRLRGTYDVQDVFMEVYPIAIEKIEKGLVIENPLAYIRGVSFNVIRELRRKQDKAEKPKLDSTNLTPGDEVFSEIMQTEDIKAMQLAWQKLTAQEQSLLQAKYLNGQTWQQIADSLSSEEERLDANTVRQRGYRAGRRLRELYEAIRETVKLDESNL